MAVNFARYSAYHGGSWKTRKRSHREECEEGVYWVPSGCDSEFSKLREVLLYRVPKRTPRIPSPEKAQQLRPIEWRKLRAELGRLARTFESRDVQVHWLDADRFGPSPPNLVFLRDLFFATPWGAVLARMASPVRAGEEKFAQAALASLGIPILSSLRGKGTFEGADALWISPKEVLVGVGNRTNAEGFCQLRSILSEFGVRSTPLPLPREVQHLLGLLQIVDRKHALLRASIAAPALKTKLKRLGYRVIEISETHEVVHRQGMNFVCVGPRKIIMAARCPELRKKLEKEGIHVIAEVEISQLLNAAGGLACATGIVTREISGAGLRRSGRSG